MADVTLLESRSVSPVNPSNPADLGWPATLPIEVALRSATPERICEAYGITREEWLALIADPRFIKDVQDALTALKQDGMSFKVKAKLQAEEFLKTVWAMVHDKSGKVPPSVQADLIKFTARCAGYEQDPRSSGANNNVMQINIDLG